MDIAVEIDNRNAEMAVADAEIARLQRELSDVIAWRAEVEARKNSLIAQRDANQTVAAVALDEQQAVVGSLTFGEPEPA